jgi:hypothetical protein
VVGFYGDVALVRYKEYFVSYPYGTSKPTGYVADVYLVRPSAARMQRNVIALFQDVDPTPTDNSGYSQIFNMLSITGRPIISGGLVYRSGLFVQLLTRFKVHHNFLLVYP